MFSLECELLRWVQSFSSPGADAFFLLVSNRWAWIPLYFLLALLCYRVYGKKILHILLALALLIALSDQLSVLIKKTVQRPRPCHTPELLHWLRQPAGCGGLYGFVSSHASNSMALAVFLSFLFRRRRALIGLMAAYTLLVGLSRVYLGAHFPGDILGGYLLGALLATALWFVMKRALPFSDKMVLLPDEN